jgi:hypothetical protein
MKYIPTDKLEALVKELESSTWEDSGMGYSSAEHNIAERIRSILAFNPESGDRTKAFLDEASDVINLLRIGIDNETDTVIDCMEAVHLVDAFDSILTTEDPRSAEQGEPGLIARVMESPEVTAWLIEDPVGHPMKFWLPNRRTGTDWTDDANKAVRFLRHNDANEVIAARPDMNELWVAREHMWMGRPVPAHDGLREKQEQLLGALYMVKLLKASVHALRSYEYGNSDPTMAKTMADQIDAAALRRYPEAHDIGQKVIREGKKCTCGCGHTWCDDYCPRHGEHPLPDAPPPAATEQRWRCSGCGHASGDWRPQMLQLVGGCLQHFDGNGWCGPVVGVDE